jgi:hypothetical protein
MAQAFTPREELAYHWNQLIPDIEAVVSSGAEVASIIAAVTALINVFKSAHSTALAAPGGPHGGGGHGGGPHPGPGPHGGGGHDHGGGWGPHDGPHDDPHWGPHGHGPGWGRWHGYAPDDWRPPWGEGPWHEGPWGPPPWWWWLLHR